MLQCDFDLSMLNGVLRVSCRLQQKNASQFRACPTYAGMTVPLLSKIIMVQFFNEPLTNPCVKQFS